MFDDIEFRQLIGAALCIDERSPDHVESMTQLLNPAVLEARIERWQMSVTADGDLEWQHFLTSRGWSQADLPRLCGYPSVQTKHLPTTSWMQVLWACWQSILTQERWHQYRQWYDPRQVSDDDLALLMPFITWGYQQLYPSGAKATPALPTDQLAVLHWLGLELAPLLNGVAQRWATAHAHRHHEWRRAPKTSLFLYDEGWRDFALEYPWLMRVVAMRTHTLIATVHEACQHLQRDWMQIRQYGALPRITNTVLNVETPLPRYHEAGGIQFELSDGHRIIYLPQSAPNTVFFDTILDWLQRRGAPEVVVTPRHIATNGHGWVVLPAITPPDESEYADFAHHVGALAALCDVLGVTQLTHHDVTTCGAVPCLLDATSIGYDQQQGPALAHQLVWNPRHTQPTYVPVFATTMAYLTGHCDHTWFIDTWGSDIIDGYQRYYDFVAQRRDALFAFLQQQPAFSQRMWTHTHATYQRCVSALHDWDVVHDGFDASVILEAVLQRRNIDRQPWYAQVEQPLIQGFIPMIFQMQDTQGMCQNVTRMGPLHRLTHAAQMHFALTPCDVNQANGRADWQPQNLPLLASEALASEALVIANDIVANRIGMPSGDTWLVLGHSERDDQLRLADSSLIDGNSGIALSLAALSVLPGGEHLALHAQRGFDYAFEQSTRQPQHLGGLCYAVAMALNRLPHPQQTIDRCLALIRQHTPLPTQADWVEGLAGVVNGLVALYRVYPDTNLYSIALNAGERLLQGRQRNAQGDRIWYGSVLNNGGFGSSGVLIALVRLFELSQDYRFLRAAFEITQLEDAHYDESRGGWPDLRHTPASYPITWCHGSVGVAMGRVALLPHQPVTHDHRMLSELLEGIDSVGLHEEDGLCCGNTGAIDTLLSVARALNAPHYLRRALYWSTQMVARAHDRGGYVCSSSQPGIYEHPGLWQGNAGIAYQLARCAYPRLFPSLLSGDMRRPVATTTEQ